MKLTRTVHRAVTVLSLLAVSLLPAPETRAAMPVQRQTEICVHGRDLLLQREYGEAETLFRKVAQENPEDLLGPFGMMALYQVQNLENYDFRFDPPYREWEETGRTAALKIARNPEEATAWDLLIAGGTLGISGFYRAHNSKWIAALQDTSLAFHTMERAFKKDPKLTDALLGIGLHDYWRSYFTRKLVFLPFFSDRREEGKATLERAMQVGRFTSVLADISLTFIRFQEKAYDRVLESVDNLLARYPRNTILKMLKGDTLIRKKQYGDAIREFEAILAIDPKITKSYLYIGLALAGGAASAEDKAKAKEYLEKYLALEPKAPKDWRKSAEEKLKTVSSSHP